MASTPEPPAFNLTETDLEILAMTDDQFILHDWENLKDIIGMEVQKPKNRIVTPSPFPPPSLYIASPITTIP